MPKLFSLIIPDSAEAHVQKKEKNFFTWPQFGFARGRKIGCSPRLQKAKPLTKENLKENNTPTSRWNFFRKGSSTSTVTANSNASKETNNKSIYTIKDALYVLECIEDAFIYMDKMPGEDLKKNVAYINGKDSLDEKAYQHIKKIILNMKEAIKSKINHTYDLETYKQMNNEIQKGFNNVAVGDLDKKLPIVEGKKSFLLAEFYLLYLQILAYTYIAGGDEQTIAHTIGIKLNHALFGEEQNKSSLVVQIFGTAKYEDRVTPKSISECVSTAKRTIKENSLETLQKVNKALQILKDQSLTSLQFIMVNHQKISFKNNEAKNEWLLQEIFTMQKENFLLVSLYSDPEVFKALQESFAFKDSFVMDYFDKKQQSYIVELIILGLIEDEREEINNDNKLHPLYVSPWSQSKIEKVVDRSNDSSLRSISIASDSSSDDDSVNEEKNSDMELQSIISGDNGDVENTHIVRIRK